MAGSLKGITVEIDGKTDKLYNALQDINKQSAAMSKELKGIETLLKFDPQNVELTAQKEKLLNDTIGQTEEKLKLLKLAEEQAAAAGKDINDENYRYLQREIVNTTQKLEELKNKKSTFEELQNSAQTFGDKVKNIATHIPVVGKLVTKFDEVKTKIIESAKSSEAYAKVSGAVDGAKQKVQEFIDKHPNIQKVHTAFEKVKDGVGAVGSAVENVASKSLPVLEKGFKTAGSVAVSAVKGITTAVSAVSTAIVGIGTASAAVGKEFEVSMTKASTLFGDVAVDTENLNKRMLEVSNSTGVAAAEMGEALYSALSAGIPASEDMSEAVGVLEKSAKLAKAGFTDVDTALAATAKTLNAYGLDVSAVDDIQKVLIQTQNLGITTVGELGASLAQVTPTAAAFGVSFDQVGAALAGMTAAGTPTAQATTQLNSLIAELAKNGTVAAGNLEKAAAGTKYAGQSFVEMMQNGANLQDVLDMLSVEAEKSGVSLVDMFSSLEAGKAALSIDGSDFLGNLEQMSTSADVVGEAYEKMSDTLEAKSEQIKNSVKNLGISIYNDLQNPIKDMVDMALGMVDELQTAFSEGGIAGLASAAGNVIAELSTYIIGQVPIVIDAAIQVLQGFIQGLIDNIPEILNAGTQLLTSLLEGIQQAIPLIADNIPYIIQEITNTLSQNLPQIITAGISILTSLIDGITQSIPQITESIIALIPIITQAILQNLPQIVAAGLALLLALITGIVNAIPQLITMLPTIISTIVTTLTQMLPQIIEAGILLLNALINGIIEAIPVLIEALPEIISSIVNTLIENLPQIIETGIELIGALIAGLIKAIPKLIAAVPQIIKAIWQTIMKTDWLGLGGNIIKGIISGVKAAASQLINVFKDLAKDALNAVKDFFGIHSPSSVMRDQVGKMLPAGVAIGVEEGMDEQKDRIEDALQDGVPTTIDSYIHAQTGTDGDSSKSALTVIIDKITEVKDVLHKILDVSDKDIYLNKTALVGGLVEDMDKALGDLQELKERG